MYVTITSEHLSIYLMWNHCASCFENPKNPTKCFWSLRTKKSKFGNRIHSWKIYWQHALQIPSWVVQSRRALEVQGWRELERPRKSPQRLEQALKDRYESKKKIREGILGGSSGMGKERRQEYECRILEIMSPLIWPEWLIRSHW